MTRTSVAIEVAPNTFSDASVASDATVAASVAASVASVALVAAAAVVENDFACEVCSELRRPFVVCENGHSACSRCIVTLKARRSRCPTCREHILDKNPMNVLAVRLACRFGVTPCDNVGCHVMTHANERDAHRAVCVYAPFVCPHCTRRFPGTSRESHPATCAQKPVACRHAGCNEPLTLITFAAHLHTCSRRPMKCPLKCGWQAAANECAAHKAVCSFREVCCDNAGTGCAAKMEARHLTAHLLACDYSTEPCAACGEQVQRMHASRHKNECIKHELACVVCASMVPYVTYAQHVRTHDYAHRYGIGLTGINTVGNTVFDLDDGSSALVVKATPMPDGGFGIGVCATTAFEPRVARVSVKLPCGMTLSGDVDVSVPGSHEGPKVLKVPGQLSPAGWRPDVSVAWG